MEYAQEAKLGYDELGSVELQSEMQ